VKQATIASRFVAHDCCGRSRIEILLRLVFKVFSAMLEIK